MSTIDASPSLTDFAAFASHDWLKPIRERYNKDAARAAKAVEKVVVDLKRIGDSQNDGHRRAAFTSIDGRVKTEDSFLRKLFACCKGGVKQLGVTPAVLESHFNGIRDICGVRFACPYFDEVEPAVNSLVRPELSRLGYATDIAEIDRLFDRNCLDEGDEHGYRSYHFFVRVPTVVDVYGGIEMTLCEVQARSELQHVWAMKSHDLLYKPPIGWTISAELVQDMRQISHSLRTADHFLSSIRDRARSDVKSGS